MTIRRPTIIQLISVFMLSLLFLFILYADKPAAAESVSGDGSRLYGEDRYETAAKVSQYGWQNTSDYAVLAVGNDNNLVDALTAAPLAKLKDAPILLTSGEQLSPQAEAEINRLKVKTVYVASGAGVIKPAVTQKLLDMGLTVRNLGGSDRFATSLNIAKEIASVHPFKNIIISTAWSNADALSAASIAAAKGIPIILTGPDSLPASVKSYVDGMKETIRNSYIIGGNEAVGKAVQNALPNPVRAGGANRYETNLEILKLFAEDIKPGKVYIANGENAHLVDALTGAPLAAQTGSPLILTGINLPAATGEYAKLNLLPKEVVALGGEGVVSEAAVRAFTNWESYTDANWIKGSRDASRPEIIENNLKIIGDKIILRNAKANYSIYIQGNNCTLDNVVVSGTVFIDPGTTGETTLKNVKAGKIVVMSGGQNSIHLVNSQAGTLVVTGDSGTRVEATGTTVIKNTVVTSYAILDANGGVLGTVTIKSEPGRVPAVELRGAFNDPVILDSAVKLNLGSNTTLAKLQVNANAEVAVPVGSSIGAATALQGVNADFSGGGTVNGSVPSVALPPVGGGPGGPGGSSDVAITGVKASGTAGEIIGVNDVMDISGISDPLLKIKYITATASANCLLRITSFQAEGYSHPIFFDNPEREKSLTAGVEIQFDIDNLLIGYTVGNDGISLKKLKDETSSNVININGEIYQNGQLKKSVTFKLKIR